MASWAPFQASPAWTGPRPSGPTGVLLKNVRDTELVYFIAYEGPGGRASGNFNPILGNTSIGGNASDAVTEKLLAMLDEIHTNMELYGRGRLRRGGRQLRVGRGRVADPEARLRHR